MSKRELELLTREPHKNDTMTRIKRFLAEKNVPLTADDEAIFMRWNTAHSYILQKKFSSDEVIAKIAQLFNVSIYTARNDYYDAIELYAGSLRINKKFLLHVHAEDILKTIRKCADNVNLIRHLPKLYDNYTKVILGMPENTGVANTPPPVLNINGNKAPAKTAVNAAMARLQQRLSEDAEDVEYTEEAE